MNKARRTILNAAESDIETLQATLEGVLNDEQEAFDNRPESFAETEQGEAAQEVLDSLQSAIDELIAPEAISNKQPPNPLWPGPGWPKRFFRRL